MRTTRLSRLAGTLAALRGCLLALVATAWACGAAAALRAIDTFTVRLDDPRMLRRAELAIVDSPTSP